VFARGAVHLHFADDVAAATALTAAGLTEVAVHRPEAFAGRVALPPLPRGDVGRVAVGYVAGRP
jgi:hypothetical protein